MITLIAIVYLIISPIMAMSHRFQKDIYGRSYNHTWKQSWWFGFSVLPVVAIILSIVVGLLWCVVQVCATLLEGAAWIYHNMP